MSAFYDRKLTAEDYAAAEEIIREKMLETKHAAIEHFAAKKKKRK